MLKRLPIFLILFLVTKIQASELIEIHSKYLNENREIITKLPKNYNANKLYATAYFLNAEEHFEMVTTIHNHLAKTQVIPELILVGIKNKNRMRDFTPTLGNEKNTGGAQNFISFLKYELIPYIDSSYSTAFHKTIMGHSMRGLLATELFLNHRSIFNSYIILDPSAWWDDMHIIKNETIQKESKNIENKLFLSIANSLPSTIKDTSEAMKDTTYGTIGFRSIIKLRNKLKEYKLPVLDFKSLYYPNEFHGSIPLKGYYDGLRHVFNYYKRPSLSIINMHSAEILENHYQKVSRKIGYSILPSEYDLEGLAWRAAVLNKDLNLAETFAKLHIKLYPESRNAIKSLYKIYQAKGDEKNVLKYKQMLDSNK